jgi:hypothetical protein
LKVSDFHRDGEEPCHDDADLRQAASQYVGISQSRCPNLKPGQPALDNLVISVLAGDNSNNFVLARVNSDIPRWGGGNTGNLAFRLTRLILLSHAGTGYSPVSHAGRG